MSNPNFFYNLDKIVSNFELIAKFCSNNKSEQTDEISAKCSQLLEFAKFTDKISVDYNFENLPANGFYTFSRLLSAFFDQLVIQIKTKNKFDTEFIKLINMIFTYKRWLMAAYETLKSEETEDSPKQNKPLIPKKIFTDSKLIYSMAKSDNDIRPMIFAPFTGFWLSKDIQKSFSLLFKMMAFNSRLPFSFPALCNNKKVGELVFRFFHDVNLHQPFDTMNNLEGWFFSVFIKSLITFNIPVSSRTIYLPKQDRFRLHYKGYVADFENISNQEAADFNDEEQQTRDNSPGMRHRNKSTIRCRYSYIINENKVRESLKKIKKDVDIEERFSFLKFNSATRLPNGKGLNADNLENSDLINPEKVLVLYFHGGAFFFQGSTSAEYYLRNIVNHLGGIPVLSVDYSLTVPFPVPVQELLDIYLWVFSKKDEVKQKLGFQPEKVVLTGDSAGAYFAICLSILLNELNKVIEKSSSNKADLIPLPFSIFLLYPVLTMASCAPSKTFATFELFITFPILLTIISLWGANVTTHGDFKKIEKTKRFQEVVEKNKLIHDDEIENESKLNTQEIKNSTPWYICDYKVYKNYADYIKTFFENPIITPALYDKFEEMSQTNLYVICPGEDSILDDGIELAKRWKGNVQLDVLSNCVHGFMSFKSMSNDHKEATLLLINRLQKACGLI